MSFFLPKGSKGHKRKTKDCFKGKGGPKKSRNAEKGLGSAADEDEEIPSDDSDIEGSNNNEFLEHSYPEDKETAEEKRLRLAKKYLEEIEKQERERGQGSAELEEEDKNEETGLHSAINRRLKREELEDSGKLKRLVAKYFSSAEVSLDELVKTDCVKLHRDHKCHKLSLTCLSLSNDGDFVFTGSKDGGLVQWRLSCSDDGDIGCSRVCRIVGGRKGKENEHFGHCSAVNALAVSSDGQYLASGDNCKLIKIWKIKSNNEPLELVKTFKGHRDSVTGLAFRKRTRTLYSCSADRSVKIWSLDEMAYVETLFGHQDKITGIDAGIRERAVTSGGKDGSVRVWKIIEESQLVFNAPNAASTDAVRLINEEHFVTCGEDGHLALWGVMKKKPIFTVQNAHGKDETNNDPNWISAVATLPYSDLVATGSRDGYVRLWQCAQNFRSLQEIQKIPVQGFVNGIAFAPNGKCLYAAVGQEHRLGRWWRDAKAKNGLLVIPLSHVTLPDV